MSIRAGTKWTIAALAAFAVSGCSLFEDDEETLPGERIPVRATAEERTTPPEQRAQISALGEAITNADWTQVNGDPTHVAGHLATDGTLSVAWTADIGEGGDDDSALTASPIVAGGTVFTLDAAAQVSAFGASSGGLNWRADLSPEGEDGEDGFGGGLAFAEGRVFATTGFGELVALNASTGEVIWRVKASAPMRAAPSVAQGIVVAIARDNTAYAYNTADGSLRWRVQGATSGAGVLGGASAAISAGGTAVIPFGSGEVVAVNLASGRRSWSDVIAGGRRGFARSAISDISADPIIQGVAVIAGNSSGLLVAIDGRSGRRGWTRAFGAVSPVWADNQTLYVMSDDAQLKRLSAQDGSTMWSTALPEYEDADDLEDVIPYGGPVLAGGRVLVTSGQGALLSFDPQSGEEVGRVEISGLSGIGPVIAGGTVYVITDGGSLIALR